jgi:hypothetical protein
MKRLLVRSFFALALLVLLFVGYFILIRKLDNDLMRAKSSAGPPNGGAMTVLPSLFRDGRVYLRVPTVQGDTLLGLCDSGGGLSMVLPSCVQRRRLGAYLQTGLVKGVFPIQYLLFRSICPDEAIPAPTPLGSLPLRHPFALLTSPYLVLPPQGEAQETDLLDTTMDIDLFFGQDLFLGRSWTIDYPGHRFLVNTPMDISEERQPGVQRIGLRKNDAGEAVFGHASFSIQVDGDTIDMLFDTGASILLSQQGKLALRTRAKTLAGSFIARSIFSAWHMKHPDWPYYPSAGIGGDLIEVPEVVIGVDTVGPVLFASRKDENWSKGMINTMDKVVKGALGGSALQYFKVTVDYRSGLIRFVRG